MITPTITASVNVELDGLLEMACETLQLTDSQLEEAEGHYTAVGEWLGADDGSLLQVFTPQIKPQGSVLQGTIVKPIGRDYADIDLICLLDAKTYPNPSPRFIYDLVANRLEEKAVYRERLKRGARCLTLEYANNFCLDILPALPSAVPAIGSVKIPDRQLNQWINSNPLGFADWFKQQSLKRKIEKFAAASALAERADVEPLPTDDIAVRPLQRATQLFKRRRDLVYQNKDWRPTSMILTALSGLYYEGDSMTCDALISILNRIKGAAATAPNGMLVVPNPSDPAENLTAGWTWEQYCYFTAFVADFAAKMNLLLMTRGLDRIKKALAELFGETLAENVIARHAMKLQESREAGKLRLGKSTTIASGLAAGAASPLIPGNTFFGSKSEKNDD